MKTKKRDIPELLLLAGCIGGAQFAHHFSSTQSLVKNAKSITRFVPKWRRSNAEKLAYLEGWSNRISSRIPKSHCLHRAVGLNVLLGLEGIDSKVVIGFRKRDSIEGHAWLEVDLRDTTHVLFTSTDDAFRSKWIPR